MRVAIFDLDGTVADSDCFLEYFYRQIGKVCLGVDNFKMPEEMDKKIRTCTMLEAARIIKEYISIDEPEDKFFSFCNGLLEKFYRESVTAKCGIPELLLSLSKKGIRMCIASATQGRLVKIALEKMNLSTYFDFVISCADVGVGKHRPDVFLEALKRFGEDLAPSDACVFEDSFLAMETAKAAGFMTVGIYDKDAFCQDRLAAASDVYIDSSADFSILF